MSDGGGALIVETGDSNWLRAAFAAFGAAIIIFVIYDLGRGVWPPNVFSLFFLLMILGACTVGGPLVMGSLFGWASTWHVTPGLIAIHQKNPFQQRKLHLGPESVLDIRVVEREAMEGDNTWLVQLTTSTQRFETSDFGTREKAEDLLLQIKSAFESH